MEDKAYSINGEAKDRAVAYLKELIANKGIVAENANSSIDLVKGYLNDYGIGYNEISNEGRRAIITGKSGVVLNSHVDVVPGKDEQFIPRTSSNRLYGRGSADALGCVVGLIVAAQELKEKGRNVTLMIVSDEEEGGIYGVKYILDEEFTQEELENIKYVVVGEPTEKFGFSIREKGIFRIKLDVYGKRSHPEIEGVDNAIKTASEVISEVNSARLHPEEDEIYNRTLHINPTIIQGGVASNVVPDKVTIEYDIRFAYGIDSSKIIEIFENLKNNYPCDYSIIKSREASYADIDNYHFKLLNRIAGEPEKIYTNGASDYCYFFEKNISGVVYGVRGFDWHKDTEYVEIDSLYQYIENIVNFVFEAE